MLGKFWRESIKISHLQSEIQGVFPDRYLEEGLVDELSVNTRQVSVRFCNFSDLHQALQIDPQVGVVLPLLMR